MFPNYGFMNVDNEDEYSVFLKLKIRKSDPLKNLKAEILGTNKIDLSMKKKPTQENMSALRIALFEDIDNVEQLERFRNKNPITGPLSIKNELQVMRMIHKLCMKHLLAYPRTLAGDVELLQRRDINLT